MTLTLSDLPSLRSLAFGEGEQTMTSLLVRNTNLTEFVAAADSLSSLETLQLESSPIRTVWLQRGSLNRVRWVAMRSGR